MKRPKVPRYSQFTKISFAIEDSSIWQSCQDITVFAGQTNQSGCMELRGPWHTFSGTRVSLSWSDLGNIYSLLNS